MKFKYIFYSLSLFILLIFYQPASSWAAIPTIGTVSVITPGNIEKYSKFEVKFNVTTVATNMYYPYDPTTATKTMWGTISDINWNWQNVGLTGINVDMLVLPPGQSDWNSAKKNPCFYYQPVEEVGPSSTNLFLEPVGVPDWRCRYAPETTGSYQYKITAADAGGTATPSAVGSFTAVTPATTSPTRHGFVQTNLTDPNLINYDSRFFTFSDGMPFVWPLVTEGFSVTTSMEPKLTYIRSSIQTLSTNGIKFVRWFPTDEGGGLYLFGGPVHNVWQSIGGYSVSPSYSDTANGNLFGYKPGDYSAQYFPAKANSAYLMTVRAKVTGSETLKIGLTDSSAVNFLTAKVLCSAANTGSGCDSKQDGWNTYTLTYQNGSYKDIIGVRLYGSVNPPDKGILVGVVSFQRDESGTVNCLTNNTCKWGSNLVSHGDPDTYRYVDQIHAAYLDEIFKQSEQNGVYQKLTLFHKNDDMLNYFKDNGTYDGTQYIPWNFYSSKDKPGRWIQYAYARYFIARYSYSTALHSLEQANENDPGQSEPGGELAKYISSVAPRHILMSNSYWVYLNPNNWTDPIYGPYFDYADKHWYANHKTDVCNGSTDETLDPCGGTSSMWQDTVANVRYTSNFFRAFTNGIYHYQKPVMRGETGIAVSGTQPMDPALATETTGTYYHKKIWAHVGNLGYLTDGEWYPQSMMYPSYKAYDVFIKSETTLNNGTHVEIGTDNTTSNTTSCTTGNNCITNTNSTNLRAFGSKDPATSRVLVWVDNKNNTWSANPNNSTAASGTFTISGMPSGNYTQETWDTRAGTFTTAANALSVGSNGILTFSATTAKDVAYKFYNTSIVVPSPTPLPTASSSPVPLSGDVNGDRTINGADMKLVLGSYLGTGTCSTFDCDINNDSLVNLLDAAIVIFNFGRSY